MAEEHAHPLTQSSVEVTGDPTPQLLPAATAARAWSVAFLVAAGFFVAAFFVAFLGFFALAFLVATAVLVAFLAVALPVFGDKISELEETETLETVVKKADPVTFCVTSDEIVG